MTTGPQHTSGPAAEPPGSSPAPLWNIANVLTMVRIAMVPVFAVLLLQGTVGTRLAATAVFLAAALTDKVDGHLARSRGLVTDFGKLADPIADKALVLSALVLLSVQGLLPWWVTVVIAVRELGITALRFVMVRRSVMAASRGGKIKTVLQVLFITGLLIPWSAVLPAVLAEVMSVLTWVLVIAAVVVTVVTAVEYAVQAVRLARRPPAAGSGASGPP